jgi:hypothetical protein
MLRAMTEQPPPPPPVTAGGQPGSTSSGNGQRVESPPQTGNPRRAVAFWGGGLAGLGVAVIAASLLHVIEQANPNGLYGDGIGGTAALLILLAGPAIGFGLGMVAASLIPDAQSLRANSPTTSPTSPASGS